MMKRLLIVLAAFVLSACTNTSQPDNPGPTPTVIDASQAGSNSLKPDQVSQLGQACGPNTQKICATGLSCKFAAQNSDQGLCVQTVVNQDLECSTQQKPVCGLIGNNKNGYLNECQARRHGAVVVNEGFCKPDPSIIGRCDARAYSLGNCQQVHTGARFDEASQNCVALTLVGCGADIPFKNVADCQAACQ